MKTIDDIYVNYWCKSKPAFTELEIALMEGGHSLEKEDKPALGFIKSLTQYDDNLVELCNMIKKNVEQLSKPGMVAACVIDPKGRVVSRTSKSRGNKWVHAERNAVEAYEQIYGELPSNSMIVTTLSPCNEHRDTTAKERVGDSCTDYLNSKGIKNVYCGYMDPTQDNSRAKFKQVVTTNKEIKAQCKKFADSFLKDDK